MLILFRARLVGFTVWFKLLIHRLAKKQQASEHATVQESVCTIASPFAVLIVADY